MASAVPQAVIDQVTQTKTVIGSAITLLNGIAARIQAGIAQALLNGATEAELAPVQMAVNELTADTSALAAAVAANTPGGP